MKVTFILKQIFLAKTILILKRSEYFRSGEFWDWEVRKDTITFYNSQKTTSLIFI